MQAATHAGGGGSSAAKILLNNGFGSRSRSASRSSLGSNNSNRDELEIDCGFDELDDTPLSPQISSKELAKRCQLQRKELEKKSKLAAALQRNVRSLSAAHHKDQALIKQLKGRLLDTEGKVGTLESLVTTQGKQLKAKAGSKLAGCIPRTAVTAGWQRRAPSS